MIQCKSEYDEICSDWRKLRETAIEVAVKLNKIRKLNMCILPEDDGRFNDGLIYVGFYRDEVVVRVAEPVYDGCDIGTIKFPSEYLFSDLKILEEAAELKRREEEFKAKKAAAAKESRRKQYEELKKEFEG